MFCVARSGVVTHVRMCGKPTDRRGGLSPMPRPSSSVHVKGGVKRSKHNRRKAAGSLATWRSIRSVKVIRSSSGQYWSNPGKVGIGPWVISVNFFT